MPSGSGERAAWRSVLAGGDLVLRVHVRPGASRPGIAGVRAEALAVRVRARPVGGAANRELLALLAGMLGAGASAVTLEAGARSRTKRVRVRGVTADAVQRRIEAVISVDKAGGGD